MKKEIPKIEAKPENSLFREEVINRKKGSNLGKVIIVAPLSYRFWSFGIFGIVVVLGLFLYFGKYTIRQEVQGILVPNKGLINIYAGKSGIVRDRFIQQGDEVKEGQILYLISTEQHNLTERSLSEQQIASLEQQVEVQKNRITMFEKNIERCNKLRDQGYMSESDYQKNYDAYLSSKLSLHDLEYRLNEVKGGSNYAIRASCDGTVSALTTMTGDPVTERSLLISIIPKGAVLQGLLYVPSDAIGFIQPGQKVLLKYQAYPYQQFGIYESVVETVDKSILSPSDIKTQVSLDKPFYRVVVTLKQQTVTVYGKPRPLIAGMLFQGTVYGERRRIWQWILNPIYSIKGNII